MRQIFREFEFTPEEPGGLLIFDLSLNHAMLHGLFKQFSNELNLYKINVHAKSQIIKFCLLPKHQRPVMTFGCRTVYTSELNKREHTVGQLRLPRPSDYKQQPIPDPFDDPLICKLFWPVRYPRTSAQSDLIGIAKSAKTSSACLALEG
ncbi:hypothetical protein GJ496_006828 [Pomphorhynchus laevis]|nr:hypothetical protein GJ496_006828 [Pomphorhynchus laevis]